MKIQFVNKVKGVKGIVPAMYEAHYLGFEDIEERGYQTEDMEEKIALLFEIVTPEHQVVSYKVRPFISRGKKTSKLASFLDMVYESAKLCSSTDEVYSVFNALFGRKFIVGIGVTNSGWNTVTSVALAPSEKKITKEEATEEATRALDDDIPLFEEDELEDLGVPA